MKKFALLLLLLPLSCSTPVIEEPGTIEDYRFTDVSAGTLASVFASLPMELSQLREVHRAVSGSSVNGYDEEYTMDCLIHSPGAGVGDSSTKAGEKDPGGMPLREMLRSRLQELMPTRSGVEDIMETIAESGYQLYWPYSEEWDGESYPVITFDPGYGAETNIGYELSPGPEGAIITDTLVVDEAMALKRPVWVINSNSDAAFTPLELFKPSGVSGGWQNGLIYTPEIGNEPTGMQQGAICTPADVPVKRYTAGEGVGEPRPASRPRRLILKSFKMLRNYDSWFGGASEFWVKVGSVEGFTASTDAELKLYYPSVTDFMIVVKRREVGKELPYDAIMVTDFTSQLDKIAFLIVEDDGGSRTNWKCSAVVKVQSKAYGIELDIPYNEKDDIVWRGQLSARFFEEEDIVTGRFGDVVCSFELD